MTGATAAALAACGNQTSERPYAGEQDRPVAGRSPQEVADLLAGRGLGYALAAELNHHPGPTHALDLADELDLTEEQEARTREIRAAMQAEARRLGAEIVALERELDEGFASRTLGEQEVADLVGRIAETEGRLRAAHSAAHLAMAEVLTPEQIARYDELRGYGTAGHGDHGGYGSGSSP